MDAEFLRQMARQCHDLMRRARTETARTQLRLWVEEFEAQAEVAEMEERNRQGSGSR